MAEKEKNPPAGGGQMTVEEAGRKGGETVKRKYGPEFYSRIGHMGGQRVRELIEEGKSEEEMEMGMQKESR